MNFLELHDMQDPLIDEFARTRTWALAALLCQYAVSQRIWLGHFPATPEGVAECAEQVRTELKKWNEIARDKYRGERLDRVIKKMNDGTWEAPKRRRRKAKRSAHA